MHKYLCQHNLNESTGGSHSQGNYYLETSNVLDKVCQQRNRSPGDSGNRSEVAVEVDFYSLCGSSLGPADLHTEMGCAGASWWVLNESLQSCLPPWEYTHLATKDLTILQSPLGNLFWKKKLFWGPQHHYLLQPQGGALLFKKGEMIPNYIFSPFLSWCQKGKKASPFNSLAASKVGSPESPGFHPHPHPHPTPL